MIVNRLRCLEHRERIDKTEEMHLEGVVLHLPFHQFFGPEGSGKETGFVLPRGCEQVTSDAENVIFDRRIEWQSRRAGFGGFSLAVWRKPGRRGGWSGDRRCLP